MNQQYFPWYLFIILPSDLHDCDCWDFLHLNKFRKGSPTTPSSLKFHSNPWRCGWNLLENIARQLNIWRILILRIRSGFLNKNIKFFHLRRSVWGVFALLNMIIRPGSSQYHPVSLCHHSISVHIYLGDQVYDKGRPSQYLTLSFSHHTDLQWQYAFKRFSTILLQKES